MLNIVNETKLQSTIKELIISYSIIIIGDLLVALCINLFITPSKFVPGGLSGLSSLVSAFVPVPVSVLLLIFNLPLFVLNFMLLGSKAGLRTIISIFLISVLIQATHFIKVPIEITEDYFLNSILLSLTLGLGLGLVLSQGATTGGTDIIGKLIYKFSGILTIGTWIVISDLFICLLGLIIFQDYKKSLYSLMCIYIYGQIADYVLLGHNSYIYVSIISDYADEMEIKIKEIFEKRPTVISVVDDDKHSRLLQYVFNNRNYNILKNMVLKLDNKALIITSPIIDVKNIKNVSYKNTF